MRLVSTLAAIIMLAFPTSLSASEETEKYEPIRFTYGEADCCSCFVHPGICGGGIYMRTVQTRIYLEWLPPVKIDTEKIQIQFRIHRNGRVSDIKAVNGKNSILVESARKAVKDAAPFYPLPEGAPDFVDILFTFPSEQEHISFISRNNSYYNTFFKKRLAPYLMNLQIAIRKKWEDLLGVAPKTVVSFQMDKEGKFSNIAQESPSQPMNQVLRAIQDSSPIDLPPGLPGKIKVKFTFDPAIREPYLSEVQLLKQ